MGSHQKNKETERAGSERRCAVTSGRGLSGTGCEQRRLQVNIDRIGRSPIPGKKSNQSNPENGKKYWTFHSASGLRTGNRSEEHTSELQSLMRISYAVLCLKQKTTNINNQNIQLLYT